MRFFQRLLRALKPKPEVAYSLQLSDVVFAPTSFTERYRALQMLPAVKSIHTLLEGAAGRLTWEVYFEEQYLENYSELLDAYAGLLFADWLVLGEARFRKGFIRDLKDYEIACLHPSPPLESAGILLKKLFELERAEYQAFWRQGAMVFAVIQENTTYIPTPDSLDTARKILQNNIRHAGAGGVELLPVPLEFKELTKGLKEYGFTDQKVHLVRELCNLFAIDSSLMNDPDNKTYSNKTEAQKALYVNVIIPNAVAFAKSLERELFRQNQHFTIKVDYSSIESISEMRLEQTDNIISLYEAGIITLEEAQQMLHL